MDIGFSMSTTEIVVVGALALAGYCVLQYQRLKMRDKELEQSRIDRGMYDGAKSVG